MSQSAQKLKLGEGRQILERAGVSRRSGSGIKDVTEIVEELI